MEIGWTQIVALPGLDGLLDWDEADVKDSTDQDWYAMPFVEAGEGDLFAKVDEDGRVTVALKGDDGIGFWDAGDAPALGETVRLARIDQLRVQAARTARELARLGEPGPAEDAALPWEVADGRGSLAEAVVLAAPHGAARTIVAKGSRRTCEFIARLANQFGA